ncbi:hypothetical protein NL676_009786 [Syzygium grande]|nr:hypothetical protein NL676_009786 [Syzygium grande]
MPLAPFPTTTKTPAMTATTKTRDRDFLLRLKAYLAKQDATKIILSSSLLPETYPLHQWPATRVFCRRSARGRSSSEVDDEEAVGGSKPGRTCRASRPSISGLLLDSKPLRHEDGGFACGRRGEGFGGDNRLSGGLPSSFENLKQLTLLDLSHNDLRGDIPGTLWNLKDLEWLFLGSLNLNGVLNGNDLFKLKNLRALDLSFNNISFTKSFINATTSKLAYLTLDSCNLTEFPLFIGYLSKLEILDLPHNRIRGTIPRWMWNNSKESLRHRSFSQFLTQVRKQPNYLPLRTWNILTLVLTC